MSRFADPTATRTVDLGACECPGEPHDADIVQVRSEYSSSDVTALASTPDDDEAAAAEIVASFVVSWNLLGPDGAAWPPAADSLLALKPYTLNLISEAITAGVQDALVVPKASGGASPRSQRERTSRTPNTTQTPGT